MGALQQKKKEQQLFHEVKAKSIKKQSYKLANSSK
jgi:hypothetical protein